MNDLSHLGVIARKPLSRRAMDVAEKALNIRVLRAQSAPAWPEAEFARALFRQLRPDCVFDVGANIGQYGSALRNVEGFSGTILSFEPNPAAFEQLMSVASGDPDWHCFPHALGRAAASLPLNVTRSHNFASLKPVGETARERFASEVDVIETPSVAVKTLATMLPGLVKQYAFSRPFLKMDTQGFDLEVVAGAGSQLSVFCGLLSEVSINPLYEDVPTMAVSLSAFRAGGFVPVGLFDVQANGRIEELLECNCYCVRSDLLGGQ
jgi:FkbM family methyltransferase